MPSHVHPSDVRGLGRLAVTATTGVTSLVEGVQASVLDLPGLGWLPLRGPVTAIAGLVYTSVRGVTRAVGGSLDAGLGLVCAMSGEAATTAERDAALGVLNGLVGDHLAATGNPLAVTMRVRWGACPPGDVNAVAAAVDRPRRKVMLFVHGLCMGHTQWAGPAGDPTSAIAAELDCTPLHLHYNSGLHVSTNGRALAGLLESLFNAWRVPVEELVIVGHSMGGLVTRSALHYGSSARHEWRRRARISAVFLGTPHHGAPLERHGHVVHRLLALSPVVAPFAGLGRVRSAGITDMRHGSILDDDWDGHCRFAHAHDTRRVVVLPADVRCLAVAGSLGRGKVRPGARLVGDGLVPVASALGQHRDRSRTLALPASSRLVVRGAGHFDLLRDPRVFRRIAAWLRAGATNAQTPDA